MLIYKDFDTSLTKVKTPLNMLPSMDKTTRKRGEDLIRDRLLAFKIKNGQMENFDPDPYHRGPETMIERSEKLKQQKLAEAAKLKDKNRQS